MFKEGISISNRKIGRNYSPFIIAEMSGNHNQSIEKALEIVDAVAESGADAIKLQTYTADSLTLNVKGGDFKIKDKSSLWQGQNLHELYKKSYTPWEWHEAIFKRAKEKKIICFSSPFSEEAVDFLEELDTPAYKIASFENNHLPLIKKASATGKPLIISTGMASLGELEQAVLTAKEAGCEKIILLKCTSTYPANAKDTNISTIKHLRQLFNCEVGISDHTFGIGVSVASIAFGSSVIEKHFTLARSDGGVDSQFSMEPKEFSQLVNESKRAWEAIGEINYGPTKSEEKSLIFRRSIYVARDIKKGEKFTYKNLRIVRPGMGAPPYLLSSFIGKTANKSFKKGSPFNFDQFL
ncbi:pseudaminic acid synthase [Prochlorococcus marinus str. MU1402]|uniref:pseudaminic acid synthase n=1 Tax=Prochlorococcus marinus TaxID=1219 RepID=UPI001ADC1670|nr:pseudaminic acid synthase [Prochlorococcus marinus]MBO8232364.1 pseudaminic acid synthase [Prochlorococcus marinus XMU1402]MBW3057092.1 pseudaminic acid synthase [Prochlorococcus marinus str. MU1402]